MGWMELGDECPRILGGRGLAVVLWRSGQDGRLNEGRETKGLLGEKRCYCGHVESVT